MSVYRVYVEKKKEFAVKAKALELEIKQVLKINQIKNVRIINRYDVEGIEEKFFKKALDKIFSEPLVDDYFFKLKKEKNMFAVEFLNGQYDNRADFCEQALQLISFKKRPIVKTATIYIFEKNITKSQLEKIKNYIINPIESKEASLSPKKSLKSFFKEPEKTKQIKNFNNMSKSELKNLIKNENLAMSFEDLFLCQQYFKNEKKQNPTETELKILDTYWSDHCRHTTFLTEIENVLIEDEDVLKFFNEYKKIKKELNLNNKPITLMEIATIGQKKLEKDGFLKNLEKSEEINACSVVVPIKIKSKIKEVLLMFKNETHNHPTEIEPFGGASTCLGGAIRDPLSGRSYVYHAIRVSGAANPNTSLKQTLKGKLPQRKIVQTAALGYSSYGNQIGLATGLVNEIYHEKYVAKRMEIGGVIGAVFKKDIIRKTPKEFDIVILLGGKTGRDGCGGACGSSKSHTKNSLKSCGAEVQKGNPIEERKIQRLFKNKKITKIIKKCNDFGAGGVCVAVLELTNNGILINLDKIPKKYEGLNSTELSISESQERMAVVVSKKDEKFFISEAEKENLIATKIATITKDKKITIMHKNQKVAEISREFLNSNGAKRKLDVLVKKQEQKPIFNLKNNKQSWFCHLKNLNIASQKGLNKMFDSTIGAKTVLMPYGGKHQTTKIQSMVALIPVKENKKIVSLMSYGANPHIQQNSPFFGSCYAVVESVAKIVATGGSTKNCWLSFQEYFPAVKNKKERFGLPFAAVLGALKAQLSLKIAAIGGKDSMSGSFENLDVPPTLVSFAVSTANIKNIISPEFKQKNNPVALIIPNFKKNKQIDLTSVLKNFNLVENLIKQKKVISAFAIGFGGISEAICKMCFGNKIGFEFFKQIDEFLMFNPVYGGFVLELKEKVKGLNIIGKTIKSYIIKQKEFELSLKLLEEENQKPLEDIFPTKPKKKQNQNLKKDIKSFFSNKPKKTNLLIKPVVPTVLIPVFPGTNCEFDIKQAFKKQKAKCDVFVFNNLTTSKLKESVEIFAKKINSSNIIAIPGGFSAADEPDGSAKFIVSFFNNPKIKQATNKFLKEKDGLMLGICNGFQALIKLGLIEHGEIKENFKITATLTYNEIGIHQSLIVNTKVVSNKSPWLQYEKINSTALIAVSNGQGRLIANEKTLETFEKNGQIASVYVNQNNSPTMDIENNPNGSFFAIEGLTSKDGRIFGRMGHSERMQKGLYKNIPKIRFQKIFKAGVDYFK